MKLLIKPTPSEKFYSLTAREATRIAWLTAKEYSPDGRPDMEIFSEWTKRHTERSKTASQD